MMLNMDRMVGTITPKNVFSCRGSLLGVPRLEPDAAFVPPPHTAEVTARPHTPEVIRGVRSFDMAAQQMFSAAPVERKSQRTGSDRRTFHLISLYISDTQFCFFTLSSTFVALWGGFKTTFALCLCFLYSINRYRRPHPPSPAYSVTFFHIFELPKKLTSSCAQ